MLAPRTLLVDFDGVLRRFAAPGAIEEATGLPTGALIQAAFAPERLIPALTGLVSDEAWREQIELALSALYPHAQTGVAVRRWSEGGTVDAAVLELLRRARKKAMLVLVTNATDRLTSDLDALGLTPEFDLVVNSSTVGAAKPEPAFFRAALARASAAPGAALFVDDSLRNVEAARSLGIVSVHFTGVEALERALIDTGLL
jgi:putative hydrolase of the HAD superfamily